MTSPLGASGDWVNTCGGTRWRTLPDETIEVEGEGVPAYKPGSATFKMLEQTWRNWEPEFRQVAKDHDLPASWLVAIATQETGFVAGNPERQRTIESSDGFGSIGITQPLATFARQQGYTAEDRYDPFKNIDMAAIWAGKNADKYGPEFPLIAASHNAGSPRCSTRNRWGYVVTGDYIGNVIKFNNAAIEYLDTSRGGMGLAKIAAAGVGVLGLGIAAVILLRR